MVLPSLFNQVSVKYLTGLCDLCSSVSHQENNNNKLIFDLMLLLALDQQLWVVNSSVFGKYVLTMQSFKSGVCILVSGVLNQRFRE